MINKNSKIYIAGHKGMVGSSLIRLFKKKGYKNLITRSKKQLNLLDQSKTYAFFKKQKPDAVIIAAALVGGIHANNEYRADFIYQNLQIQNNLINSSYLMGVKRLIFLGSSCIYPKDSRQPIKEEYLLTGSLEQTNEPYAIAKIAGLKMIESYNRQYKTKYLCLMPCNLYGPNDNYDLSNSHFLPALIRKIHEAKIANKDKVELWGDGTPKRELMHVDDLANSCLYFLKKSFRTYLLNVGSGEEHSIKIFAQKICKLIGYNGNIVFNRKYLNGTQRKILNSSKANGFGWKSKISFDQSIHSIYEDFKKYQN